MKKQSLRWLSALLLCAMMPVGALACANDGSGDDTTTTASSNTPADTSATETTDDGLDANGFLRDNLPSDLDFGDQTVTFLTWSDVEHEEFSVESPTGETVNDAIFSRNQKVEERLGITLEFIGTKGNYDNRSNYITQLTNAINAGSKEYDICAAYSMTLASAASKGLMMNLLDLPYLNFDQPWWPDRLVEEANINNKLYFASGDISANVLYMMYTCFFNRQIVEDYNLPNPQELVQNGEWTYAKFFELCTGVYRDLNGNNTKDDADQFGYMTSGIHTDPWYYGTGSILVGKDGEDNLVLSDTFTGENILSAIEELNRNLWATDDCIYTSSVKHQNAFAQKQLLFCIDRARISITKFSTTDVEYGIVPCPVQEAGDDYVTVMGNPFTLYGLPLDCEDPDMMSAVMECFASESYRQVTPALFEVTLKVKYSDDEISSQMYDIIRQSVTFDLGRLFDGELGLETYFRQMLSGNKNQWASVTKTVSKVTNKKLATLQSAFE